jgi:hypothetical protein
MSRIAWLPGPFCEAKRVTMRIDETLQQLLAIWTGAGILAAVGMLALNQRTGHPRPWRRRLCSLVRNEQGAAYTTSIAMVLPIFVVLLTVFIQATSLLATHLGLFYAAYAGARSASVWYGVDAPLDVAAQQVRRAVWNAGTPCVSGDLLWRPEHTSKDASDYAAACAASSSGAWNSTEYVAGKRGHAEASVRIDDSIVTSAMENPDKPLPNDVTIAVTYDCPIPLAIAGRILGEPTMVLGSPSYAYRMSARVTLAIDHPLLNHGNASWSQKNRLGVRYDDLH